MIPIPLLLLLVVVIMTARAYAYVFRVLTPDKNIPSNFMSDFWNKVAMFLSFPLIALTFPFSVVLMCVAIAAIVPPLAIGWLLGDARVPVAGRFLWHWINTLAGTTNSTFDWNDAKKKTNASESSGLNPPVRQGKIVGAPVSIGGCYQVAILREDGSVEMEIKLKL